MGGGHPAKHCTAQALLALGQPAAAARRLQTLAQQTASVAPRAAILAEAGLAWAEATLWDRALNLQLQAMKLDPSNLEIAIDTAITYAALDQDIEAVKVLNSVLVANPKRTDALVLRGSAYRRLGAIQYALDDLNLSLKRDPNHLDALLERGLLWQTLHNAIAARRDWLHLITSDPESVQAEWAQQHLQRMDNTLEDLNMDQDTSLPHAPVVLQPPTSPATDAKKPIVLKKPQ
jgi:tetratricopeptide (TPR) repeat protein